MDRLLPESPRCAWRVRSCVAAAVALALAGCASGITADQGYKTVSVTYQYTDQNRPAREWRALLTAQDECYLGGFEYAQPVGQPKTVCDGGMACEPSEATMSYYCIGLRH